MGFMDGDFGFGLKNTTGAPVDIHLDPSAGGQELHSPHDLLIYFFESRIEYRPTDGRQRDPDRLVDRNRTSAHQRDRFLRIHEPLMAVLHMNPFIATDISKEAGLPA